MAKGNNGKILSKFARGEMSPQETHQALAWGGKGCTVDGCGCAPVVRALSFAPLKEVETNAPAFLMRLAFDHHGAVPIVEFTYGKFVRIGEAFACANHKTELERAMAKGPSWVLVEWDYGPDPANKITSQVPGE